MNPDLVDIMQRCTCGHGAYTHGFREPDKAGKRLRGFCAHGDAAGNCPCRKFVPAVTP